MGDFKKWGDPSNGGRGVGWYPFKDFALEKIKSWILASIWTEHIRNTIFFNLCNDAPISNKSGFSPISFI